MTEETWTLWDEATSIAAKSNKCRNALSLDAKMYCAQGVLCEAYRRIKRRGKWVTIYSERLGREVRAFKINNRLYVGVVPPGVASAFDAIRDGVISSMANINDQTSDSLTQIIRQARSDLGYTRSEE